MAVSFIGGGKPENLDKTPPWTGFKLTTLVVIGTDCTGSYKSNYHDHDHASTSVFGVNILVIIEEHWAADIVVLYVKLYIKCCLWPTFWYCEYLTGSFSNISYVCDSKLSMSGWKLMNKNRKSKRSTLAKLPYIIFLKN